MIFRPAALLLGFFSIFILTIPSFASDTQDQFGVSVTMFTTMAAINAAGYDDGLDSVVAKQFPIRNQIRDEIAKKNVPCLAELRAYYQKHKKPTGAADLGQYISYAVLAAGPPFFELPMGDLPPDAKALTDFGGLLVRFYKEADIETLWKRAQPAYATAIARYQDAVIGTLFEANGYVRNNSGFVGRRFQILLDLQGAPNQVQVRNYRDNYFVVITPSETPAVDEIRDTYLSYLLDPLSFRYRMVIDEHKNLLKYAQDAPALEEPYKQDYSLLLTKSLIKAIDSRLMHADADQKEAFVNQAMREGYILTRCLADLLPAYEKQQETLASYYPDMMSQINPGKVEKQAKSVEFVKTVAPKIVSTPETQALSTGEQTFEVAEGLYEREQYGDAARLYKKVFEQTADKQLHGRCYYRLGQIAIRDNQKSQALEMFERTVQDNPDPVTTAWAHVWLGRLAKAAGESDKANEQFKLALNTEGASPTAREAAQQGLKSISPSGDKQE